MVAVPKQQQQTKKVLTEKQPKQEKIKMPEVQKEKEKAKPVEKKPELESGTDPVKRVRNLKKKLKNIEELEVKVAEGQSIDNDQRKKISSKNLVSKEIASLEALIKVMFPSPPKPTKKDGKKDAKKDNKKETSKKETKQENKPNKANDKKPASVLTNGTQAKKVEKKTIPPVQQNGTAAIKKTEKVTKPDVKTKAQPKTQAQTKTQSQSKTQVQPKTQPKAKPAAPVIEISVEAAKRIRNLKKKLKTIDELELKVAQGGKIDNDQRVKISKKSEVLAEIQALESGK
ncbi:partner of Y14 and mago isoform X2 [Rhopalosiphum padi]|nr:partner of Y14 and mago isoform X2 [Rhopalosiphum padi]